MECINESAAQVKRERALNSIDVKIAEVVKSLDQVQAPADLRNKALLPLQELKTKVAGLSSIPKIMYVQEQAGTLLDDAMGVIEKASQQATPKAPTVVKDSGATTTSTVLTTAPKSVAPKPSRSFVQRIFLRRFTWKPKPRSKPTSPGSKPSFWMPSRPGSGHGSVKRNHDHAQCKFGVLLHETSMRFYLWNNCPT